jgi:formate-dependent nitrite reductase cytochrome c552 subunit
MSLLLQQPRAVLVLAASSALLWLGCGRQEYPRPLQPAPGSKTQPVTIHQPERLTRVPTGELDANGKPLQVACATCHSLRAPGALPKKPEDLDEFHTGLRFAHGTLQCASCHQQGQYDALRLADGRAVPMADAMTLCAQCHGTQFRSYTRGAHGGMNGYWDLSRGPRERNNCVDCHDPHTPKFQGAKPVLKPRDRLLSPPAEHPRNEDPGHE